MNFLWQQYLEEKFPGKIVLRDGTIVLNKANTARKFALDQTIGAVVNTVLFIGTFTAFKGGDVADIQTAVSRVSSTLVHAASMSLMCPPEHIAPDEEWLEAMAHGIHLQLHPGARAQADLGGKLCGVVLGDLLESHRWFLIE